MTPTANHDLSQWLTYLASIHVSAIDMGLERVLPVFEALKITPPSKVFMVAGTNGKGSTTATIHEICVQAGLKTALYQSPHLVSFNERIKIGRTQVGDDELIRAFCHIEEVRQSLNLSLSFFEMTTLSAFWLFCQANCDVWVLEVGLGGRLDVVNVIEPDVCVITNIAIDHVEWLGDTLDKIGYEKAGIIRANKPIIFGAQNMPSSVQQVIDERQAILTQYGYDYIYDEGVDDWIYSAKAHTLKLPRPTLAIHNVATAISAIIASDLPIESIHIMRAMQQVHLAGRCDLRTIKARHWLFDVAHNRAGVDFLLPMLHKRWQDFVQSHHQAHLHIVFGMLADKDSKSVLLALKDSALPFANWYVATLDSARTMTAEALAGQITNVFGEHALIKTFDDINQAIACVLLESAPMDFVVVMGSFHTVGESLLALKQYDGFAPKNKS